MDSGGAAEGNRHSPKVKGIKLAVAGERAGFTVEQMIRLLNAGLTVECLLDIIEECLSPRKDAIAVSHVSSSAGLSRNTVRPLSSLNVPVIWLRAFLWRFLL
jgi:hypothetical protein